MHFSKRILFALSLVMFLLGVPFVADAGWVWDCKLIVDGPCDETDPRIVSDGADGFMVAYKYGCSGYIYARAIDIDANLGSHNSLEVFHDEYRLEDLVFDGEYFILTYNTYDEDDGMDRRLKIARFTRDNTLWTRTLAYAKSDWRTITYTHADVFDGYAYVTYVVRYDYNGEYRLFAAKRSLNGNNEWTTELCPQSSNSMKISPEIVGDEEGGAIIVWEDHRDSDANVYAQRIDNQGIRQWSDYGLAICTVSGDQRVPQIIHYDQPSGIPDDYYILWEDDRASSSSSNIYAYKIDTGGNDVWNTPGGINIIQGSDDYERFDAIAASDGFLAVFEQDRSPGRILAGRYGTDGVRGWGGLKNICAISGLFTWPKITRVQEDNYMVVWRDWRDGKEQVYAQRIRGSDGGIELPLDGLRLCWFSNPPKRKPLIAANIWGAVTVFQDYQKTINSGETDNWNIRAHWTESGFSTTHISAYRKRSSGQLDPLPENFAISCPQGDGDKLVIEIDLDDISQDVAAEDITVGQPVNNNVTFFGTMPQADAPATYDNDYNTTVTIANISGCGIDEVPVYVHGRAIGTATINVKSPDRNSDGEAELLDFSLFSYDQCEGDAEYDPCFDYVIDPSPSCVDLIDFAVFSLHYNHYYSPGGPSPVSPYTSESNAVLSLSVFGVEKGTYSRQSSVDIGLNNANDISAAAIVLELSDTEHKYAGFTPAVEFNGTVLAIPIEEKGKSLIYVMATTSNAAKTDFDKLGTLKFNIREGSNIDIAQEDVSLKHGEILTSENVVERITDIDISDKEMPTVPGCELKQNYPNPFNPTTTIQYSLSTESQVNLSIYDVQGHSVRTIVDEIQAANNYSVQWDGTDNMGRTVASGVYWYRIKAGTFVQARKMLLLK